MAKRYVKDLNLGEEFQALFVILKKTIRTTRNGEPYLSVILGDKTGVVNGKMWFRPDVEVMWDLFQEKDIVQVKGIVEDFQNQKQLKIEKIIKYSGDYEYSDFLASIEEDIDALYTKLQEFIQSIQTEYLKSFLLSFFTDEEFVNKFKTAPAARKWHDNKIGGLLKHTVNVAVMCQHVLAQYPDLNLKKDLLISAAILHDAGKVDEYDMEGVSIEKTDEGKLIGHTNIILMKIHKKIEAIKGFPKEAKEHLLHMIISHHGYHEYGAAVLPATLEAVILHCSDMLDSMIMGISQLKDEQNGDWVYSNVLTRWLKIRDHQKSQEQNPSFQKNAE